MTPLSLRMYTTLLELESWKTIEYVGSTAKLTTTASVTNTRQLWKNQCKIHQKAIGHKMELVNVWFSSNNGTLETSTVVLAKLKILLRILYHSAMSERLTTFMNLGIFQIDMECPDFQHLESREITPCGKGIKTLWSSTLLPKTATTPVFKYRSSTQSVVWKYFPWTTQLERYSCTAGMVPLTTSQELSIYFGTTSTIVLWIESLTKEVKNVWLMTIPYAKTHRMLQYLLNLERNVWTHGGSESQSIQVLSYVLMQC